MEGRLLFRGCSIIGSDATLRRRVTVTIVDDRIAAITPDNETEPLPGDWVVPCAERLALPGFCDPAARLSTAMEPQALATEMVTALAFGLLEGTTSFLTYRTLASDAILDAIEFAVTHTGVRMCTALTIPATAPDALSQLDTAAHIARNRRGFALGLSGTPSEELLASAQHLALESETTLHLLAPDGAEGLDQLARESTVTLSKIPGRTMLKALHSSQATTVLSPGLLGRSFPEALHTALDNRIRVTVGTFGRPSLRAQLAWAPDSVSYARLVSCRSSWLREPTGAHAPNALAVGTLADIILLDACPQDGVFPLATHSPIAWVVVGGRVVVRERQLVGIDIVPRTASCA